VSLAEEIAIEERHQMLVPERTTVAADEGNVCYSRHEEKDLDGRIGAVAEAAFQHGAGKDLVAVETGAAGHSDGPTSDSLAGRVRHKKKKSERRRRALSAVFFLACDGPGKRHDSCWKCAGYSTAPLDELSYPESADMRMQTYVFCAAHLELECCARPYELYSRRLDVVTTCPSATL
jgi:hypothetical protein